MKFIENLMSCELNCDGGGGGIEAEAQSLRPGLGASFLGGIHGFLNLIECHISRGRSRGGGGVPPLLSQKYDTCMFSLRYEAPL